MIAAKKYHEQLRGILPHTQPDAAFFDGIVERIEGHHARFRSVAPDYYYEEYEWGHYSTNSYQYKALPYGNWNELMGVQTLGHQLRANSGAAITVLENFTSYTIGKGITFTVKARDRYRNNSEVQSDVDRAQDVIDLFLSDNCWPEQQEEALRNRLLSSGDLIRRYGKSGTKLDFAFVDSHELGPPKNWKNEGPPPPFGIEYKNGDIRKPDTYWIDDSPVKASEIQHRKIGTDSKDERGVPLLWSEFCNAKEIDELDFAAARAAVQYCKHTVNYEYPEHTTPAEVQDVVNAVRNADLEAEAMNKLNAGGSVHHATGYKVTGMAHQWSASGFIDLIDFKMRRLGNIASQPEYLSTGKVDTGGRANLLSAESATTRRVERSAAKIAKFDIDLLYNVIAVAFGKWDQREEWIPAFKMRIEIKPNTKTPDGRDAIKRDQLIMDQVEAGYKGPISAIKEMNSSPEDVIDERRQWAEMEGELTDSLRDSNRLNQLYDADELSVKVDTVAALITIGMTEDEAMSRVGIDAIVDRSALEAAIERREQMATLQDPQLDDDEDDEEDVETGDE